MSESFWPRLDELLKSSQLVIDRPAGSAHPKYPAMVYPLDYGYLEGTSGGDGNEIDVWRGTDPAGRLDAIVCTVDMLKRDTEIKLLVGCSPAERQIAYDFHSGKHMSAILILRQATDHRSWVSEGCA